jgi:L-lactate utilization protein LutB
MTFIVVTIDKLVESFVDALFQARCTAMYGLQQIILDLFDLELGDNKKVEQLRKKGKGSTSNQLGMESLLEQYTQPENLYVILLDDSRSELKGTKQEELLYCIGCRRCGLHCPRIRASGKNKNLKEGSILTGNTARELLLNGYLAGPKRAIADGLFECTLCKSCSELCPVGIDLTGHVQSLREYCQEDDLFAEPHKRIRKNISEVGNAYGAEHTIKTKTAGG